MTPLRQRMTEAMQLRGLARSDAPATDIEAQAQALMAGVANVLATELKVRAKVRCDKDIDRHPGRGFRPDGSKVSHGPSSDTGDDSPAAAPQEDPANFS